MHTCRQQRVTDAMRTIGGYGSGRQRQRRMPAASVRPSARPRVRRSRSGQRWMAATCVIPVCVGRRRGNFSRSWPAQAGPSGPNGPVSISPSRPHSRVPQPHSFSPLADHFCAPDDGRRRRETKRPSLRAVAENARCRSIETKGVVSERKKRKRVCLTVT